MQKSFFTSPVLGCSANLPTDLVLVIEQEGPVHLVKPRRPVMPWLVVLGETPMDPGVFGLTIPISDIPCDEGKRSMDGLISG